MKLTVTKSKNSASFYVQKSIRKKRGIPSGQGLELCRAGQAEANAIDQCARRGTSCEGSTLYVTTQPCVFCYIHD